MSMKSQQENMRRLHELLSRDLGYVQGERECGPNGAKKIFLNQGKVFLRALAKDLGLRDVVVKSNAAGIAVSGDCSLYGMWDDGGIYVCIEQPACGGEHVILYRTIRNIKDNRGGYNNYIRLSELADMPYKELLRRLGALRKVDVLPWAA